MSIELLRIRNVWKVTMVFRRYALVLVIFGMAALTRASATVRKADVAPPEYVQSPEVRPRFVYDACVRASDDLHAGEVHLYVEFVNDLLQFHCERDRFMARYQLVVEVLNQADERVDGSIVREQVHASAFDITNSRKHITRHTWRFTLDSGRYRFFLELTDVETGRRVVRTRAVNVPRFNTEVSLSDLAFVDHRTYDSDGPVLDSPNLLRTWQDPESEFGAFVEVYSTSDTVRLNYRVYDQTGVRLLYRDETIAMTEAKAIKFIPLRQLIWWPGEYLLIVEARHGTAKASRRASFGIRHWEPSRLFLQNERKKYIMDAMRYIAAADEYAMLLQEDEAGRIPLTEEFWLQRDPTPGTERNELREVFRQRVDYAVKHFSNFVLAKIGSDSDRGRIHILYGQPSEKKRFRLPKSSRLYELWYYKKLDQQFVFVDKKGIGEFELIHQN